MTKTEQTLFHRAHRSRLEKRLVADGLEHRRHIDSRKSLSRAHSLPTRSCLPDLKFLLNSSDFTRVTRVLFITSSSSSHLLSSLSSSQMSRRFPKNVSDRNLHAENLSFEVFF